MKNYLFDTYATMKPNNRDKYYILSDIIKRFEASAESVADAVQLFVDHVRNDCFIDISKTAVKNKQPMYIDTAAGVKQVGYVITASTEFSDENNNWKKQYIDLWVSVSVIDTAF